MLQPPARCNRDLLASTLVWAFCNVCHGLQIDLGDLGLSCTIMTLDVFTSLSNARLSSNGCPGSHFHSAFYLLTVKSAYHTSLYKWHHHRQSAAHSSGILLHGCKAQTRHATCPRSWWLFCRGERWHVPHECGMAGSSLCVAARSSQPANSTNPHGSDWGGKPGPVMLALLRRYSVIVIRLPLPHKGKSQGMPWWQGKWHGATRNGAPGGTQPHLVVKPGGRGE